MKIFFYIVSAALCMALTLPAQGSRSELYGAQEPDSTIVDYEDNENADTVAYEDWDNVPDDSTAVEENICQPDDELLAEFNVKEASYDYQNKANANTGITLSATIFTPGDTKKQSGYNIMVSRILQSMLPGQAMQQWKTETLDKMLENKWKAVKEAYINDLKDWAEESPQPDEEDDAPYFPSYAYNTSVMPVWRFSTAGGLVTYKIDDEVYLGGAHGMPYCYCLTLSEKTDSLVGLTDIFKEESLNAVFDLVGQKLAVRHDAPYFSGDVWKPVAEMEEPSHDDALVVAHAMEQFGGKWYPRPAVTQCGILFSYPPYEKDCFAAGTVEILLPFEEVGQYLKCHF